MNTLADEGIKYLLLDTTYLLAHTPPSHTSSKALLITSPTVSYTAGNCRFTTVVAY